MVLPPPCYSQCSPQHQFRFKSLPCFCHKNLEHLTLFMTAIRLLLLDSRLSVCFYIPQRHIHKCALSPVPWPRVQQRTQRTNRQNDAPWTFKCRQQRVKGLKSLAEASKSYAAATSLTSTPHGAPRRSLWWVERYDAMSLIGERHLRRIPGHTDLRLCAVLPRRTDLRATRIFYGKLLWLILIDTCIKCMCTKTTNDTIETL